MRGDCGTVLHKCKICGEEPVIELHSQYNLWTAHCPHYHETGNNILDEGFWKTEQSAINAWESHHISEEIIEEFEADWEEDSE